MSDPDFDSALVKAAFALGAEKGWRHVSGAAAARYAGLDLAEARVAAATTSSILKKFGRMADAAALKNMHADGSVTNYSTCCCAAWISCRNTASACSPC
jgi:hypothetical protein